MQILSTDVAELTTDEVVFISDYSLVCIDMIALAASGITG
jgi:hypothetical protein